MKKFLMTIALSVMVPAVAAAQQWNVPVANDEYAYASIFAGNFSLLLSILIGIIATFLVFRSAHKLGGGLFGLVLNYIGVGMLLIVLGTISTSADAWLSGLWLNVISTACFALGYIFMVIGANKLLRGIMNN